MGGLGGRMLSSVVGGVRSALKAHRPSEQLDSARSQRPDSFRSTSASSLFHKHAQPTVLSTTSPPHSRPLSETPRGSEGGSRPGSGAEAAAKDGPTDLAEDSHPNMDGAAARAPRGARARFVAPGEHEAVADTSHHGRASEHSPGNRTTYKHVSKAKQPRQRPQPKSMSRRGTITLALVLEVAGRSRRKATLGMSIAGRCVPDGARALPPCATCRPSRRMCDSP